MKKQNIILYVINFILIGFIIFSNKGIILDNNRVILKNMDETTQVNDLNKTIETLNNSHTKYTNYIEESKLKIASAITDMGVKTTGEDTLETIASNIRNIPTSKDAASISYDNTNSELTSINVQGAIDEIDSEIEQLNNNEITYPNLSKVITSYSSLGTYTIPSNGWIIGMIGIKETGLGISLLIDGVRVCSSAGTNSSYFNDNWVYIPVTAGQVLTFERTTSSSTVRVDLKLYEFK